MSGLCGLVDFVAPRMEPEDLRRLAESASYRAPGGIGYRYLAEAGLAHLARHAADRDQPLLDSAAQVCAVLDGRLDNRSELIAQLSPVEGAGASDVRLLLAAYLRWGEACTDYLLGDFAFAVWDAGRHQLLCAVDPLGIKPLHFARIGPLVCFASDATQVLWHPAVPDAYNEDEIAAYLGSRCENPERSFFAAVRKLAPGQRLIANAGGLRVERYWNPQPAEIRYGRDEEYAAHFRELFERAVTDRLRDAGSFVGVAMSGGLDSTSVAAVAHSASGPNVRAYTFAFDQLAECDERSFSRTMTEELGLEVEPIEAERLWRLESRVTLPVSADTPFMGWRTCHAEIFSRMAAGGSRLLLMGHGGDDLLHGSSLAYVDRLHRGDLGAVREVVHHARSRKEFILRTCYRYFGRPHLPVRLDRLLRYALGQRSGEKLLPPWIDPHFAHRVGLEGRQELLRPAQVFASTAQRDVYANLVSIPWYWRLTNWYDRCAATFGIEVRHPFLDRRLFEYILAIPGEQLFRLGSYKNLLRLAMEGVLPERIRLRRNKTRFVSFLEFGLRGRMSTEILNLLRSPLSAELGILDGERLRAAYSDLLAGETDELGALWYAICLEIWLRRCAVLSCQRDLALAS
jgi:asparagine synthase (glutamine-hydrolysing)